MDHIQGSTKTASFTDKIAEGEFAGLNFYQTDLHFNCYVLWNTHVCWSQKCFYIDYTY